MKRSTSSLLRAHSRDSMTRLLFESECSNGGGGDDRSILYRICQLFVVGCRLVTPLSYLYCIYLIFHPPSFIWQAWPNENLISIAIHITRVILVVWAIVEVFFLPYYCFMFVKLLRHKDKLEHVCQTKEGRFKLLQRCFGALKDACDPHDQHNVEYLRKVSDYCS